MTFDELNLNTPLLSALDDLGYRNYLYILWVFSIVPIIDIIQNDLTARMVNRDVLNIDKIDDIFVFSLSEPFSDRQFGGQCVWVTLVAICHFEGHFPALISSQIHVGEHTLTYMCANLNALAFHFLQHLFVD